MIYTWFLTNGLKLGGILALFGAIWLHGCNYGENRQEAITDKLRIEYNQFVSKTEELGKAADAKARAIEAAHKLSKEKADADAKREITELRDRANRMLVARARGSYLPEATTTAGSPDDITFDRAELERALQRSDARVQALIVEGDEAKAKLAAAVKWAAQWAAGEKAPSAGLTIPKPSKPSEPIGSD